MLKNSHEIDPRIGATGGNAGASASDCGGRKRAHRAARSYPWPTWTNSTSSTPANVEPFSHATDNPNAFREDKVTNQPNADALLANAPDRDETFFKVPKIIE